jgi:hypothetical protein
MDFAVIEVEIERAVRFEDAPCFFETGLKECPVIGEGIVIGSDLLFDEVVTLTLEADSVSLGRALALVGGAGLDLAGVERWVDIDQVDACGGHGIQEREVVAEGYEIGAVGAPILR